mmetsp:Transcript_22206/g.32680  ORF Transcript_22206/g.32680 Transcript_22206/m.32680 type:complete len:142 (+) Transcript_22206:276-701(+)
MKSAQDKFHVQSQIRRNAEECNDYLRDLLAWEEEKRGKEAELCRKTSNHNVDDGCTKKHVTLDKIKCIHQEPPKTNKSLINSSALLPNNEKPHLALDCYHEVGIPAFSFCYLKLDLPCLVTPGLPSIHSHGQPKIERLGKS